jgi:hypothetical protein
MDIQQQLVNKLILEILHTKLNLQIGLLQDKMDFLTLQLTLFFLLIWINNSMEMFQTLELPQCIQEQPLPQQDKTLVH